VTGHLVPLLTCDGCQYRQVPATHRDQTLPQLRRHASTLSGWSHHDHATGTWTLIHDCDHDQVRCVVSTGHHHWQDAARHAFTLELPHPEAFA